MSNPKQAFARRLKAMHACPPAVSWVRDHGHTLRSAWAQCQRVDWLLWLATRQADEPGWSTRHEIHQLCYDLIVRSSETIPDSARMALGVARQPAPTTTDLDAIIRKLSCTSACRPHREEAKICSRYRSHHPVCAVHVTASVYDLALDDHHAMLSAALSLICALRSEDHGAYWRGVHHAVTAALCAAAYAGSRDTVSDIDIDDHLKQQPSHRSSFCSALKIKHQEVCELIKETLKIKNF